MIKRFARTGLLFCLMLAPALPGFVLGSEEVSDPDASVTAENPESRVREWIRDSQLESVEERVRTASALFVGRPYLVDPLGEGLAGRYDQDPRYRWDGFDCTTFVETILALSGALSYEDFERRMDGIRYLSGRVDFTLRNHFPSLDWIPNNQRAGYLLDQVREVMAGREGEIALARALIDKPRWYSFKKESQLQLRESLSPDERAQRLREWQAEGQAFQAEFAELEYIPFTSFFREGEPDQELAARIADGAIVNLVRPNWDLTSLIGTHMNVSHQMLLVRDPQGRPRLRHASSVKMRVVDQDFFEVLRSYLGHPTARGIQVMRVMQPAL
jgi:hypothetical protein